MENKLICPACGSTEIIARGVGSCPESPYAMYECTDCNHYDIKENFKKL